MQKNMDIGRYKLSFKDEEWTNKEAKVWYIPVKTANVHQLVCFISVTPILSPNFFYHF